MTEPATAASNPVTEPCPHCGCPVAPGEWFEDDEGTLSCTCCALRDECDPNDPDCTCRREGEDADVTAPFPDGWPTVPSLTVTRDGRVILAAPLMDERQSFDIGPYTVWVTR